MTGNARKHNPIRMHFLMLYMELFEFYSGLDVKLFDMKLSGLTLPVPIKRQIYNAKHEARYCEDRVTELKRIYALRKYCVHGVIYASIQIGVCTHA